MSDSSGNAFQATLDEITTLLTDASESLDGISEGVVLPAEDRMPFEEIAAGPNGPSTTSLTASRRLE